jgi:non-heme chloroperoxidase
MSRIKVGHEGSTPIELYYEDYGTGKPVVLIHGWPLSGASWEKQVGVLLAAGYRVITYDRRGFGRSSHPSVGYDYDTFANDLEEVLKKLDVKDCALVGFSMGGGEVARYLGTHGAKRVSHAVFISSITPCLLKAAGNPTGVDGDKFEHTKSEILADRPAFLAAFFADFYNIDLLGGKIASQHMVHYSWNVAVNASAKATHDSVDAWLTDFRADVARIDIPTLILHGDADRILPIDATAHPLLNLIPNATLKVIAGGPHGMTWTHAEQVNTELLEFLHQHAEVAAL